MRIQTAVLFAYCNLLKIKKGVKSARYCTVYTLYKCSIYCNIIVIPVDK